MGFIAGPEGLLSVKKITKKAAHEFFQNVEAVKALKGTHRGFLGFFEASTRTSASFESAGLDLGLQWVKADPQEMSLKKGESLKDTFEVLSKYDFCAYVVRHSHAGFADKVFEWTKRPVFNAGDGMNEHPTQALGDAYCLWLKFGSRKLKIALFGDVFRSRVARSNALLLKELGHKVVVCGDGNEESLRFAQAFKLATIARKNLKACDLVMALRVQAERGSRAVLEPLSLKDLGPKTYVMHPGPVIVHQDIQFDILRSLGERNLILDQVRACYLVRRRLLYEALGGRQ